MWHENKIRNNLALYGAKKGLHYSFFWYKKSLARLKVSSIKDPNFLVTQHISFEWYITNCTCNLTRIVNKNSLVLKIKSTNTTRKSKNTCETLDVISMMITLQSTCSWGLQCSDHASSLLNCAAIISSNWMLFYF